MSARINPYDDSLNGSSATATVGFYGATPVVQASGAGGTALTLTTATSGGFGFSTSAAFIAHIAQIEAIRAAIVALGLHKGS